MSVPAHYVTSEWYQPGLMDEVGMGVSVIALILFIFIGSTIGARYLLRSKRRLSPATRKALEFIAGLTKPVLPGSSRHRHKRRSAAYGASETRYRLQPADTGDEPFPDATRSDASGTVAPSYGRRRIALDLTLRPEESWPYFAEDEIDAVVEVLRSGKVNQWTGSKVFDFEQTYSRELRNGRAIALANGSVALELALHAMGVGPGDEVIVTPRTFVASAFCVRLVGATPVFVDVDRDSGNITAETIAPAITPRTKAIIPVHLGGWPADMPAIMALARQKGIQVLEDCAQAHGAEIDGLPVGSFGEAASFSFCQDKIITTGGEGGLVTLRDDAAYEYAWSFKDHGKDRKRALDQTAAPGFRWLHDRVGTNWRMTEISAAIGLLQLHKLPLWRARRAANADIWADALSPVPGIRVPRPPRNVTAAYYKFYAYLDVDPVENERLRDRILKSASAAGLRAFSGSCSEVYREAAFDDLSVARLPIAKALGESSLMFEVHPTLDERRQRYRAEALAEIIAEELR